MNQFTNRLPILLLAFLWPAMMVAQRTISGTVKDAETQEPLIGANVLVVGTSKGTTTDINGAFQLDVPEGTTTLEVSYTGYTTQQVPLTASNLMTIALRAGENLDEILVIGYGEIKKEDATGAIQSVTSKDFNQGAITSAQDLVAGKIAGVNITPSTDPGGGAGITVRGLSSLRASNAPLIVIDGVPLETNNNGGSRNFLNIVNPNDIETFTVLKDASASAIYGSRASGGVILITTKKGKGSDKFQLNYNGNVSMNQVTRTVDVFNADDFRRMVLDKYGEGSVEASYLGDANTDWQSLIYQNAIGTDHNVNFSGGVKGLPYRASVGYTNKEGVLKTEKFERTTLALNLNPKFLDNTLQVNISSKAMFTRNRFADRGAVGTAVGFDPTQPVYANDSLSEAKYGGFFAYQNPQGNPLSLAPTNPIAMLELRNDASNVQKYIVNGSVDYRFPFLPELRANLNLGYDYFYGEGEVRASEQLAYAVEDTGSITNYWNKNQNRLLEFYLNYVKDYGNLGKVDFMAGYSWQNFFFDNYSFSRNLPGNEVFSPEETSPREYYLVSLYSRLNYTWNDLLVTLTLRRDGSSRFSEQARWGLFPSAAAAYKVFDGRKGNFNSLKVRVGYGVTGQQDIGNGFSDLYPYLPLYDASQPNAQYQLGGQFYTTLRPRGYDASIRWEETATLNAGIDFGILDNRITGSLDYYLKNTSNLLNEIDVAAGSNFTNRIVTNVGSMSNSGVELSLQATPISNDRFSWEIGGNATYEQNQITQLIANNLDTNYLGVFTGGISGINNNIQIHSVGYPLATFFVYEQLYDDNGNPIEGAYADRDGDGQGGVGNGDRYHSRNPNARWFFGINTRLTYDNWELSMSGRARLGNYIYNNIWSDRANYNALRGNTAFLSNLHTEVLNIGFEQPQLLSDLYLQDGSFFRMDYITLSYFFPKLGGVKNVKVFATVQNPITITSYPGLDPEVGGIDGSVYPRSRAFLLGLSGSL